VLSIRGRLKYIRTQSQYQADICRYNVSAEPREGLINTPQGMVSCLYSDTPKNILGLHSDGFSVCNIMVLVGKDNNRISLTHVDGKYLDEFIKEDIEWVGKDSAKYVYHRDYNDFPEAEMVAAKIRLVNSGSPISFVKVAREIYGISVDCDGKITQHHEDKRPNNLLLHPEEYRAVLTTKIHEILCKAGSQLKLSHIIYNGGQWHQLAAHNLTLCESTQSHLKECGITNQLDHIEIEYKLLEFYEKTPGFFYNYGPHCLALIRPTVFRIQEYLNIDRDACDATFKINVKAIIQYTNQNLANISTHNMNDVKKFINTLSSIVNLADDKLSPLRDRILKFIEETPPTTLAAARETADEVLNCIVSRDAAFAYSKFKALQKEQAALTQEPYEAKPDIKLITRAKDVGLELRKAAANEAVSAADFRKMVIDAEKLNLINEQGKDSKKTALHQAVCFAVKTGDRSKVDILLNAGADSSIKDKDGYTPLMYLEKFMNTSKLSEYENTNKFGP
jgi:hypothetical protein